MPKYARIFFNVDTSPSEDHPEPVPLRQPAANVLTAQVGLDDVGCFRVIANKLIACGGVDQKCLIEARLHAVKRTSPGIFLKRYAALTNLLEQGGYVWRLQHPCFFGQVGAFGTIGRGVDCCRQTLTRNIVTRDYRKIVLLGHSVCIGLLHCDDAWKDVGIREQMARVAEIGQKFDPHILGEHPPKLLCIASLQPLVGDDIA